MDDVTKKIADELKSKFNCHTVVLYGSRARGDWNEASDYDILGVSDNVDRVIRHAYRLGPDYIDGFVYPTATLATPDSSHLYMREGIVIFERDGFGRKLISALADLFAAGPRYAADELEMKRIWAQKMIERAKRGDSEGLYRKHWLIYSLLEDYFTFRGLWYEGPKKAFAYLNSNDPAMSAKFEAVLRTPNDLEALSQLASLVAR